MLQPRAACDPATLNTERTRYGDLLPCEPGLVGSIAETAQQLGTS